MRLTVFKWLNGLTWGQLDKKSMIIYLEGPRDFLSIQERQWSLQDTRVQLRQVHLANDFCLSRNMTASNLMTRTLKTVGKMRSNETRDSTAHIDRWSKATSVNGCGGNVSEMWTVSTRLCRVLQHISLLFNFELEFKWCYLLVPHCSTTTFIDRHSCLQLFNISLFLSIIVVY